MNRAALSRIGFGGSIPNGKPSNRKIEQRHSEKITDSRGARSRAERSPKSEPQRALDRVHETRAQNPLPQNRLSDGSLRFRQGVRGADARSIAFQNVYCL